MSDAIPPFNPNAKQEDTGFDEKDDVVIGELAETLPASKSELKHGMTFEEAKESLAELAELKHNATERHAAMQSIVDEFTIEEDEKPKGNPNLEYIAAQVKRREELALQIKAQEAAGLAQQTRMIP